MKNTILVAGLVLGLLFSVLLINSFNVTNYDKIFNSKRIFEPEQLPLDSAKQNLSELIKFKTITHGHDKEPEAFKNLLKYLKANYSLVFSKLELSVFNHSLLLKWKGKTNKKPILFMAHMDVVPVQLFDQWVYPPFSGHIDDMYIWGRGALDNKSAIIAHLESIQWLLEKGNFEPQRDIYFSFGADEELGGYRGAGVISKWFQEHNIEFDFILDEGGMINQGEPIGYAGPVAYVGVAEKGYGNLVLSVDKKAGHSSMPPEETAIQLLAKALAKLDRDMLSAQFAGPTSMMFDHVAYKMPFFKRLIFSNTWLFKPVISKILSGKNVTNAFIRTTLAPTLIKGGVEENVLPSRAEAIVNFRTLPGDNMKNIKSKIEKKLSIPSLKITISAGEKSPSSISSPQSEAFHFLAKQIKVLNPKNVVAPFMFIGGTDSIHFSKLSKNIFRFSPFYLKESELTMIHGVNEKISHKNLESMMLFYLHMYQY